MTLRPVVAAVGLLALAGCPGRLDDPESFKGCTLDVEKDIFIPTCGIAGCHDATTNQNNLDLKSPGIATRIAKMSSGTCEAVEPLTKLMASKISPNPSCNSRMPLGTPLTDPQIKCVNEYLANIADGGT